MRKLYIDKNLNLAFIYSDKIEKIIDLDKTMLKNIYAGRVKSINKSLGAAFIDLNGEIGFYQGKLGDLNETDIALFQVTKIQDEDKRVKLSLNVSIRGKYIVKFLYDDVVKISKNIDKNRYIQLKKLSKKNNFKKILFRTESKDASDEILIKEYEYLTKLMEDIKKVALDRPKLIYEFDELREFIRDNVFDVIITNSKEIYNKYKSFNIEFDEKLNLKFLNGPLQDYKNLFEEEIYLENSSSIIIEKTRALTIIDVNGGAMEDGYTTNLKLANEVVRQIMLRNISGIILIDFISMDSAEEVSFISEIKKIFDKDRTKINVYGFTNLGLLELSRKSDRKKLLDKRGLI